MKNISIDARKEAKKVIEDYAHKKRDYIFIHYSRQNCFDDAYEKGSRVISIVVMNAESEQNMIFSLRKTAENNGCNFFLLLDEKKKDNIELEMLEEFYRYVNDNKEKNWLHWNMKNNNFGFSAIENRFIELGGTPIHIDESRLINISVLLKKKYGVNFAGENEWHGKIMGKMYDIFILNNINDINILNGEEEIIRYILKNIMSIEQSLMGKLKAFQIIMDKTADDALKTRAHIYRDVYGLSIKGIIQYIHDNVILATVSGFIGSIIGGIVVTVICNFIGL